MTIAVTESNYEPLAQTIKDIVLIAYNEYAPDFWFCRNGQFYDDSGKLQTRASVADPDQNPAWSVTEEHIIRSAALLALKSMYALRNEDPAIYPAHLAECLHNTAQSMTRFLENYSQYADISGYKTELFVHKLYPIALQAYYKVLGISAPAWPIVFTIFETISPRKRLIQPRPPISTPA